MIGGVEGEKNTDLPGYYTGDSVSPQWITGCPLWVRVKGEDSGGVSGKGDLKEGRKERSPLELASCVGGTQEGESQGS